MSQTQQELPEVSGLPLVPTLIIMGVLLIIFFGILGWAIFNDRKLNDRDTRTNQSPTCLITACVDSTKKVEYRLDPNANPNTAEYETVNYCTVNAPPTSFVRALQQCATMGQMVPDGLTADKVRTFATFYNNDYIDTCGYNWKTRPATSQKTHQPDPTLVALIPCAARLQVTGSDIDSLRTKCGSACTQSMMNMDMMDMNMQ